MPEVFIGIGANIKPQANIKKALGLLQQHFHKIHCSPAYQNAAMGFDGPPFINLAARFHTTGEVQAVINILKQIEHQCGRIDGANHFASRTMDLDLLLYGDCILNAGGVQIPRDEILQHAYVLKPLADLYPQGRHPQTGETFLDLWQAMNTNSTPSLLVVELLH